MSAATREADVLGRVMVAFEGDRLPEWMAARLAEAPAAGMTVFRHMNVRSPGQVRELVEAVQAVAVSGAATRGAAAGGAAGARGASRAEALPLLIAADHEGGQLQPFGDDVTGFPGNMALGAIGDTALTEQVGEVLGTEARAMGINVVFAPVMDVASNADNAAMGIRSFGDDPTAVAEHGAAMIRGLRSAGVAAAAKHFPGLGDAAMDTHFGRAVIEADRARLERVEFPPFRAAIEAGVDLVMSSHVAIPALTGEPWRLVTLSAAVMRDLLRGEFGFAGVTISDALDMAALAQDETQRAELATAASGIDLFLCGADRGKFERIEASLLAGAASGAISASSTDAALERITRLRRWLAARDAVPGLAPGLEVIGSAEHRRLESEVSARALTLVRDPSGWLPLRVAEDATIVAIMPTPTDLTPADTSSTLRAGLGEALQSAIGGHRVRELVVRAEPTSAEISAARAFASAPGVGAVVVGTIDARHHRGQAELVRAVADSGVPTVAVAMRGPWDVLDYPGSVTAVCTYSIHAASMDALATALLAHGRAVADAWPGRLPVALPRVPA